MKRKLTSDLQRSPVLPAAPISPELDTTGCSDSDQPNIAKPIPEWVQLRPFQYNGRVLAAALPGLCIVLSLTGDLLLSIIVIGALVLHLLDSAGAKRQSLLVFLCFFIMAQIAIIYSAIPVVWISILNIFFLFILNMFVVLTGGWVLLQFEALVREEPIFAELIEISLFSIYPAVSIIITSWTIGTIWTTKYLHYVVILHGFLLLRLFITPNQPSFRKPSHRASQTGIAYVIGAPEIAVLLLFYSVVPTVIFVIFNFWNLTKYEVLLEFLHVISTPMFLVSLLELRSWTEHAAIPVKIVAIVRWISGFVSLLVTCILLMQTKFSVLVPWIFPLTIGNVLLGSLGSHKGTIMRAIIYILAFVVGLMYIIAILNAIPWHLDIPNIDLSWISVWLITCAALSVVSFLVANAGNKQLLSTLLIFDMAAVVYVEYMLFRHNLYSPVLLVGTSTSGVYLLTRLHNAGVIAWHAAWIGSALHSIKLLPVIQSLNTSYVEPTWFRSASVLFLVLVTSKLVFFENRKEIPILKLFSYVFAICASVMLFYFSVLRRLWMIFSSSTPTIQDATSIYIIVCSAICLKLTFFHMQHQPRAHRANVLVAVVGLMLLVFQPTVPSSLQDISDWFIIISACLMLGTASGLMPSLKNLAILSFVQSLMVGIAAGAYLEDFLLHPQSRSHITLLYVLSCTMCALIGFRIWNMYLVKDLKCNVKLPNLTVQFVMLVAITLVTLIVEGSALPMGKITLSSLALSCTQMYCGIYLCIALILRLHWAWQKSIDPFNYTSGNVVMLANLSATFCYLFAILNCPIEPWEIWNCICSIVLLLLQPDSVIMPFLHAQKQTGILISVCLLNLYIASVIHCNLWHVGLGFFGIFELLILIAILPFYLTLIKQFCSHSGKVTLEVVVFVTPINSLLFIVGSSYTSWLLATVGLSAGAWVAVYELSVAHEGGVR